MGFVVGVVVGSVGYWAFMKYGMPMVEKYKNKWFK